MYLDKLFAEFKKVYGIRNKDIRLADFKDEFSRWLINKQKAMKDYIALLQYMDLYSNSLTEVGKGLYDTIGFDLKNDFLAEPIIITPYADSFIGFQDEFDIYKGFLVTDKNHVDINYDDNALFYPEFHDIDTFITQLPLTIEEIIPFLRMLNTDKTIYLGTYGSVIDKNSKANIDELLFLYHKFLDNSDREITYNSETQNDNYVAAIKVENKHYIRTKQR